MFLTCTLISYSYIIHILRASLSLHKGRAGKAGTMNVLFNCCDAFIRKIKAQVTIKDIKSRSC